MTDEEIKGIAAQTFNMAKRDREQGDFNFLFASYHKDQGLHRMTKVERIIIERLGENWLNSGRDKDLAFGMIALTVQVLPPDAVVFSCVINKFRPTKQFHALSAAEQEAIMGGNHDRHWKEVKAGNLAVCDALLSTVQTPARVCLYTQRLEGDETPEVDFMDQEEFSGRMKFFGNGRMKFFGKETDAD